MPGNEGIQLVDLDEEGVDRAFRADVLAGALVGSRPRDACHHLALWAAALAELPRR